MPTILSHPAVAIAAAYYGRRLPRTLVVLGAICKPMPMEVVACSSRA